MASKFEQSAKPFVGKIAQITRGGVATIVSCPPGPPKRIDGYTVGVIPNLEGPAPHRGEVHPDGDELLYLVSGAIEVILDDGDEHSSAPRQPSYYARAMRSSSRAASGTNSE
jgi:hypothetical protein